MADIILHRENEFQKTVVPNYFIDAYMVHANGEYVKVYLYLLRCMNDPSMSFSISDTADKFDHTEKDIIRALKYWEKMRLLRLEFDEKGELTDICFLNVPDIPAQDAPVVMQFEIPAAQPESYTKQESNPLSQPRIKSAKSDRAMKQPAEKESPACPTAVTEFPPRKGYSAAELQRLKEESDIQELLFVAEHYIGHPLNATEMNAILYWKETLNFSGDLIDYLIESCVTKNHKSVHYMEKIALSWAKAGISTVTAAKEEASTHGGLLSAIRKAFGIQGRDFVPYEKNYIDTWQKEYGFGEELVTAACERTIRSIHQVSFEYADSILKNWKKHQVQTMQDVQALDALHQERAAKTPNRAESSTKKNRFNDFPQRSYDTSQLEKELLNYGIN